MLLLVMKKDPVGAKGYEGPQAASVSEMNSQRHLKIRVTFNKEHVDLKDINEQRRNSSKHQEMAYTGDLNIIRKGKSKHNF